MLGLGRNLSTLATRRRKAPVPIAIYALSDGLLPGAFSFSRASSALYMGDSGIFVTAPPDAARFEHIADTGDIQGMLIEEEATNLVRHNSVFSNGIWSRSSFLATTGSMTAPDGVSHQCWSFGNGYVFQDFPTVSGEHYTTSIWIKANKSGTIGLRNLSATDSNESVAIGVSAEWNRYQVTAAATSTTSRFLLDNRANFGFGESGLEVCLWNAQVEAGFSASSPISTGATTASRAADVVGINGLEGIYDLRVVYASGHEDTFVSQVVANGYYPPLSDTLISRIEVFREGAL